MKKYRYTLHDVAKMAGVSYQTVSRVINDQPNVAPETRTRIEAAIIELGYRPNKVAKSLVANRSYTLALLTFGMNHYGPTQMVLSIARNAKELGYDLIFSNVNNASHQEIRRALDSLHGRQVDGILSILPVVGISYQEITDLSAGTPVVQIDPEMGLSVPSVVFDQKYGSQLITEYLIHMGHRQIAEISGPLNWFGAMARHQQWKASLQSAGLTPGLSLEGDWTAKSGYECACRIIASGASITALVVGNDQMALGAIRAFQENNLYVPQDVSVVGFDDIPEARYFNPALTTVEQNFNYLGAMGVRYLLELIQTPDTPIKQHLLTPQLKIRESSAPVKHG